VAVLVVLAGAAGWAYVEMRGSLAQLDGEATMPGATGAIVVERDALGIRRQRKLARGRGAWAGLRARAGSIFQMDSRGGGPRESCPCSGRRP
jgi:hypothetical protein